MAGLPGTGKTTLANKLGKELHCYVLDRGTIKDALLEDDLLRKNVSETMAGRAAYEAFFKMAEDILIKQRLSVILDSSTLHPFILEKATRLAEQANVELKIIHCCIDEETRRKRLHTRQARMSQAHSHLIPEDAEHNFDILPSGTLHIRTENGKLEEYREIALAYVTSKSRVRSTFFEAFFEGFSKQRLTLLGLPKSSKYDVVLL
jgi:predicted kinase